METSLLSEAAVLLSTGRALGTEGWIPSALGQHSLVGGEKPGHTTLSSIADIRGGTSKTL